MIHSIDGLWLSPEEFDSLNRVGEGSVVSALSCGYSLQLGQSVTVHCNERDGTESLSDRKFEAEVTAFRTDEEEPQKKKTRNYKALVGLRKRSVAP